MLYVRWSEVVRCCDLRAGVVTMNTNQCSTASTHLYVLRDHNPDLWSIGHRQRTVDDGAANVLSVGRLVSVQ